MASLEVEKINENVSGETVAQPTTATATTTVSATATTTTVSKYNRNRSKKQLLAMHPPAIPTPDVIHLVPENIPEKIISHGRSRAKQSENQPDVVIVRKKPGRPKKNMQFAEINYQGICKEGSLPGTVMELHYTNPTPLKKVINLLKTMEVIDLKFIFTENKCRILTSDHLGKNDCVIDIMGAKMQKYFCEEPFQIVIDPDNVKTLINLIDKNCERIILFSNKNTKYSFLNIQVQCITSLGIISNHAIDLMRNQVTECRDDNDTSDYPLSMTIPSKTYKKYIGAIYSCSDEFTIYRNKNNGNYKESILFMYKTRNKKINSEVVITDGLKDIIVKYTGPKDSIFGVSVKCEYCKPLSTILLSDFITIRVHENRKINFECQIREECYVNVFSEVIRGNFMLSS